MCRTSRFLRKRVQTDLPSPTSPLGDRWFRGTLFPTIPQSLNPCIPWGGVYPFPTLPRGPRTGEYESLGSPFWRPGAFQERSKNPSNFLLIFERILAPFWLPKWLPKPPKIRSGPEAPGRDGVRFGLLSVYWCCCSFVGCSAVSLPSLVALLGPKICQSNPLPKEPKKTPKISLFFNVVF